MKYAAAARSAIIRIEPNMPPNAPPSPKCDIKAPRPRPRSAPPTMPRHGLAGFGGIAAGAGVAVGDAGRAALFDGDGAGAAFCVTLLDCRPTEPPPPSRFASASTVTSEKALRAINIDSITFFMINPRI